MVIQQGFVLQSSKALDISPMSLDDHHLMEPEVIAGKIEVESGDILGKIKKAVTASRAYFTSKAHGSYLVFATGKLHASVTTETTQRDFWKESMPSRNQRVRAGTEQSRI
ncbi:hypothetical protein U9M48_033422 [Paspalum notatum var. saurae]|uniref:Uncharacterized protein n=1 Tax=Paspalum notatum var. saurae TaxID=547442 RepID=A0AAQ3U7D3_PASNO